MGIFSSIAGKLVNSLLVQPAVISRGTLDDCCYFLVHSGLLPSKQEQQQSHKAIIAEFESFCHYQKKA